MSIARLERVTFAGVSADKDRLLDELHARGCLELIPLRSDVPADLGGGPSSEAREALKFLLACPQRRRQVRSDARFDVQAVERQALELRDRIHGLEAERDFLIQRLADFKPWGDFRFPAPNDLDDLRLWFYVVPHKDMPKVEASGLVWNVSSGTGVAAMWPWWTKPSRSPCRCRACIWGPVRPRNWSSVWTRWRWQSKTRKRSGLP